MDSPNSHSVTPSCPWGKKSLHPPAQSFSDLMDEEFAQQLQKEVVTQIDDSYIEQLHREDQPCLPSVDECLPENDGSAAGTDNDLLLAQMLQLDFDRENDEHIKSLEKQYNGTSKVSMSFKNFQSLHPYDANNVDWDSEDSDDEYDDIDDTDNRKPTNSQKKPGGIITKHDKLISERKNAKSVEQFPLNFASGDVGNKDIRLPNHVYNKLKLHSKKEERHTMKLHEKQEHSTHEKALDEKTRLILYKLVNNGTLENINGIISTGKEAVVLHANGGELHESTRKLQENAIPNECALKVFKTTLNEFKTREKYIKDDHRFKDRFAKQNPRKIIRLWAEKEFRNLSRLEEAGINCPRVVGIRKHILIMSFVGKDQKPAQKLKDVKLNKEQFKDAYQYCVKAMKTLFEKCNLIHADLSEYNILWHDSKCYFIDVSQSIEPTHPNAFHFLLRDCRNIIQFFKKANVTTIMSEKELFQYVCGKELDLKNLDEIENESVPQFEKDVEMLTFGIESKKYEFNYHFEISTNRKSVDKKPIEENKTGHAFTNK